MNPISANVPSFKRDISLTAQSPDSPPSAPPTPVDYPGGEAERQIRAAVTTYIHRGWNAGLANFNEFKSFYNEALGKDPDGPVAITISAASPYTKELGGNSFLTCDPPGPRHQQYWREVASSLSTEFKDCGVPIRFQTNFPDDHPVVDAGQPLRVGECVPSEGDPFGVGQSGVVSLTNAGIYYQVGPHETGHAIFGLDHPGTSDIDGPLHDAICAGQLTTMINFDGACGLGNSEAAWRHGMGPLDVCQIKINLNDDPQIQQAIETECGNKVVDLLLPRTHGAKVMGYVVSGACGQVVERSLNLLFDRTVSDPTTRERLRLVSKILAGVTQALILSQMSLGGIGLHTLMVAGSAGLGKVLTDTFPLTKTLRATLDLAGHPHVAAAVYQTLKSGNIESLVGIAAGFGGTIGANAVMAVLEKVLHICSPVRDATVRDSLLSPPSQGEADVLVGPFSPWSEAVAAAVDKSAEGMPTALQRLTELDAQLAGVINHYLSLHFLKSYIYPTDESAAAAQVQQELEDLGTSADATHEAAKPEQGTVQDPDKNGPVPTTHNPGIDWGPPLAIGDVDDEAVAQPSSSSPVNA